jgi:hypothetical protein
MFNRKHRKIDSLEARLDRQARIIKDKDAALTSFRIDLEAIEQALRDGCKFKLTQDRMFNGAYLYERQYHAKLIASETEAEGHASTAYAALAHAARRWNRYNAAHQGVTVK